MPRRSIRGSSTSWSRPRGITWNAMPTTGSKLITAELKHRLRPMRGLRTDRTAQVVISGLAFLQNVRRGHYELATESPRQLRVAAAFTELAPAV